MGKGGSVSDREETVMPEDAPGNPGAGRMEARPARQEAVYRPVREMQAKLHRWAGEDPSRRFGDLFNLVYDPDFLAEAWLRVKKNKGSRTPGIDGATVASIENRPGGVGVFLEHIRAALKSGEYRPEPVRQVMIPKKSGKLRKLGITTVADRVVQAALKLVLEPIFEADFQPCSYGFRPNRRAHDAIAEIHYLASRPRNYEWVLEADIRACFDEIGHVALMDRFRRRIKDKKVCALVKAFLKAGVMTADGDVEESHTGAPQGGIFTPPTQWITSALMSRWATGGWNGRRVSRAGCDMSGSMVMAWLGIAGCVLGSRLSVSMPLLTCWRREYRRRRPRACWRPGSGSRRGRHAGMPTRPGRRGGRRCRRRAWCSPSSCPRRWPGGCGRTRGRAGPRSPPW